MKKGFTVIEMMVVCSILAVGVITIDIGTKYIQDYRIRAIEEGFLNEIYSLINYGREKCIALDKPGEIRDFKNNEGIMEISFDIHGDKKGEKIIKVPKEIRYEQHLNLSIDNNGNLKSMTLEWRGRESNNSYEMRIGVGNNTIRIYVNGEEKR
ncbi:MAG: pilus assembly FimT family protein [Clostridium sp.]|uniref:pilus assembly FimT family protein n=1 Tax=Clostridium sp. TaxID=1506 RepID=UPI003F2A59C8